jgi:hypothetical protein
VAHRFLHRPLRVRVQQQTDRQLRQTVYLLLGDLVQRGRLIDGQVFHHLASW